MNKVFLIYFGIFLGIPLSATSQVHTVEKREDISDIARRYNLTPFEIQKLNPHAKNGIEEGEVLRITEKIPLGTQLYDAYKVNKKETLFSIARQFGLSVEDLKKHNPVLERNGLKNRQILLIPVQYENQYGQTETPSLTYTVKPKDTKWRVAYLHGMTLAQLDSLNPDMGEVIKPGQQLKVIQEEKNSFSQTDNAFRLYEVKPKETLYGLTKRWQITEDRLTALNPELKNGLKIGMILKIPADKEEKVLPENAASVSLTDSLRGKENISLAFLLPFNIPEMEKDTFFTYQKRFKTDRNLNVVLDFMMGAQIAVDSARAMGMRVNYQVFDTENNTQKVSQIIRSNRLTEKDALIGPLYQKNLEQAADDIKGSNTLLFSPLSNREFSLRGNCVQTIPTPELLEEGMLAFIKAHHTQQNILILADRKLKTKAEAVQKTLASGIVITADTTGLIKPDFIKSALDFQNENWVLLMSENLNLISTVVPRLNTYLKDYKITLITTDRNRIFEGDEVQSTHLANLNFHFPSVDRPFQSDADNLFVKKYREKNFVSPGKFAFRGFELTLDVLLRLGSYEKTEEGYRQSLKTEYTENAFLYDKKLFGGYTNKAFYILKYNGLQLQQVYP